MTSPTSTKKCPFCAEDILTDAIKCKFCGEMLSATSGITAPERSHFNRNFLVVAGVLVALIVGAAIIGRIAPNPHASTAPSYPWQKRCDAACSAKLGKTGMWGIDTATSCITLRAMLDAPYKPDWRSDSIAAIQDQMDYRHCPGSAPRTASDPYQPAYSWQKRCKEDCANNLGREEMASVDDHDCTSIREKLPYARNPKLWSDYDQNYDIYAEESKAVLDKYDSLHCK